MTDIPSQEPRWSIEEKRIFADCIKAGMYCAAFVLAVTGSVSIWTTHQYAVAQLSFQLAMRSK